jgi:hypothetical protein
MPLINDQKAAHDHVHAWQTALPSQVIDSFYQLNPRSAKASQEHPLIDRIIAFEVHQQDIQDLTKGEGSNLELIYGFDQKDLGTEQAPFKMYLRSAQADKAGNKVYSPYHSLKSLTKNDIHQNYPKAIYKSLFSHEVGTPTANPYLNANLDHVTDEFITPTIEQWLFYAWRSCATSTLVDQVETVINGSRRRIERSKFDANVSNMVQVMSDPGKGTRVYTFVLLALHQVIPGDKRRYPFGPILQSYVVPPSEADVAGKGDTDTDVIRPVSFELTIPCPPSC